ncbi:endonuclease/exonuclease/phosphatase family protein [Agarivorans sp. MS3-6]|uniref:endonuclease/exonuclease/phosphatase family protein n=1 Tax=Agarivorans sp. TSD2052 TaxID=2937286 RepID=UPI00200C3213|nr:endonuclease/exonuclease/phosphatase family protein [Agarivorans sp. TSD2052]UPW19525.1 endonuclease/exonuclease/phosphatase family protein [Agarivorans sp. TSD2052]
MLNYLAPPFAAYEFDNILDAHQWQQKQDWLARMVNQAQPDVMAFQEVFSADALAAQCKSLGYPHFLASSSQLDEDSYVYHKPGQALASKYPLRTASLFNATMADEFSRAPLIAKVKLPGFAWVRIYVVHLKSKRPILDESIVGQPSDIDEYLGRWQSDNLRTHEIALLMKDILSCRRSQLEPVIIAGDFNDDVSQGALAHIFDVPQPHHSEIESCWRIHDAYILSKQQSPRAATHYWGGQGNILDYILLSGEFSDDYEQQMAEVVNYQCFDRHLTHADYAIDSQASDHAAVMVELRVRD